MPNVVEDVPAASPADPERGIQGTPDLGPTAGPAAGDGLQVTLGKDMPKVFVLLVASFVVMLLMRVPPTTDEELIGPPRHASPCRPCFSPWADSGAVSA